MKTNKEELNRLLRELNTPKALLMSYQSKIARIDIKKAERLDKIIAKLESFQNS